MLCVGLAACGPCERPPPAAVVDVPLEPNRELDVLLVMGNSGSMAEEQPAIAASFSAFAAALEHLDGGLPNLHLGVVTTDMGTLDVNTGDPACSQSNAGRLVKGNPDLTNQCPDVGGDYVLAGVARNYSGTLAEAIACMGAVGKDGCGFDAPLASMKAALDDNPANVGFRRPSAHLAVIFIDDADDCSAAGSALFGPDSPELGRRDTFRCFEKAVACNEGRDAALRTPGVKTGCAVDDAQPYLEPVDEYAAFLQAQVADPADVVVAAITGGTSPVEVGERTPTGTETPVPDLVPSCSSATNTADPAIRLDAFLDRFPGRNVRASICAADYGEPLARVVDVIARVDVACLDDALACEFSLVTGAVATPMPPCNDAATNAPCWRAVADPTGCPDTNGHLAAVAVTATAPPAGTHVVGECR